MCKFEDVFVPASLIIFVMVVKRIILCVKKIGRLVGRASSDRISSERMYGITELLLSANRRRTLLLNNGPTALKQLPGTKHTHSKTVYIAEMIIGERAVS